MQTNDINAMMTKAWIEAREYVNTMSSDIQAKDLAYRAIGYYEAIIMQILRTKE